MITNFTSSIRNAFNDSPLPKTSLGLVGLTAVAVAAGIGTIAAAVLTGGSAFIFAAAGIALFASATALSSGISGLFQKNDTEASSEQQSEQQQPHSILKKTSGESQSHQRHVHFSDKNEIIIIDKKTGKPLERYTAETEEARERRENRNAAIQSIGHQMQALKKLETKMNNLYGTDPGTQERKAYFARRAQSTLFVLQKEMNDLDEDIVTDELQTQNQEMLSHAHRIVNKMAAEAGL